MSDRLYRMTDAQLPQVLAHLAEAGGTARSIESWRHDHMTALLLGRITDEITAAMPLAQRKIRLSPQLSLAAGWVSSNQFATRMGLRRATRATSGDWPQLLPETDALLVVRRDEPSLAARWYAQTGFHDVLAIRCLYLDRETPPPPGNSRFHVQVCAAADLAKWQDQMLAVYRDVYTNTGGPVDRDAHFWQPALANHFYREHYQFQTIGLWSDASPTATLMGYAVVGWSGWHSKRPRMDILEIATRQWDATIAQELILTASQLAWSKNVRQVRAVISVHDPYRGHLARTGFVDRWGYVMLAKWLQPQRFLDALGQSLPPELAGLNVQLNASGQVALSLRGASASGSPLKIQADARTLTRLLLNRVDVSTALQDGSLHPGPDAAERDLTHLALAFPWTPWVFHLLDYI